MGGERVENHVRTKTNVILLHEQDGSRKKMECLKKTKILFLQCVKSNNTKKKMYLNSSEGGWERG